MTFAWYHLFAGGGCMVSSVNVGTGGPLQGCLLCSLSYFGHLVSIDSVQDRPLLPFCRSDWPQPFQPVHIFNRFSPSCHFRMLLNLIQYPEDGGSILILNVRTDILQYTVWSSKQHLQYRPGK